MRVLIVEDERDLAHALKHRLERHGFVVDLAFDGGEGLALATDILYDVVILSRRLRSMSGLALCTSLRARSVVAGILMLTERDAVGDRIEGLDAGADDCLVKPFDVEELLARVRALTRRSFPLRGNRLVAGDLTLDLTTGNVRRAGRAIALSPKEYTLLVYMLRHPDQVLTHDRLLTHVWDQEAAPNCEVVRAHIKNLRRKVDGDHARKLIKTVHGRGYRLES